ncbi:MAG: cytochrome ubiquinol oxidase subunit I [Bacteroidaceae bacterium]|nr:cytochrome ubiquinol oxidase subunit I [Bacteroidaceae bacterium]
MVNLLNIDLAAVDWARAQFALTAIYHWLFVPLTLGLAVVMGIMETLYYRTGKDFWKETAKYWQRLFGINFAMGVATGLILEFEFGTNWSNYSYLVGDIFGAPLAVEGIVAFFMESTFVAVMFFGWNKVSKGFHLASTWLTGLGATVSAWWILVANSWMQHPVGQTFNPDTMRNEMTSFADVALSPVAIDKFVHTVLSAWVLGAVFVVGVSSWYLLKQRHLEFARKSLRVGAIFGLISSVLIMLSGHHSAYTVAQTQPMKLAAMEALYKGGTDQPLTLIAGISPFRQPDYETQDEPPLKLAVPYALSFLATNDINGYVPGVRDILDGYTKADGTQEPSLEEKIERGRAAIAAIAEYRGMSEGVKSEGVKSEKFATASGNLQTDSSLFTLKSSLEENMPYFGYGYVSDRAQVVPYIPVCFYAFRVMVGGGCLFILLFLIMLWKPKTWNYWLALLCIPIAYIVSEAGWLVAEFGRQPWTIQDMLPTWVSVSQLGSSAVMLTFFLFLILFTLLLALEINIMCKAIKKGPETNNP